MIWNDPAFWLGVVTVLAIIYAPMGVFLAWRGWVTREVAE